MKIWIKRSLITLFGVTLLAGGLTACGHRMHSPMSDEKVAEVRVKMIDRAGKDLELNEAQKAKLGVLADRLREQQLALRGQGSLPVGAKGNVRMSSAPPMTMCGCSPM